MTQPIRGDDFREADGRALVPWWAVCLCLAVSFVGVFGREFWVSTEARVGAICLEMSRSGSLIVPHLAGVPFVEKPPLYYTAAAGAIRALGPLVGKTVAIRLTNAFWSLLTLGAMYVLARRLLGRARARLAVAFLATLGGFVAYLDWVHVDAALVFFVIAAVAALAEAHVGGRSAWLAPAGLLAAGAFLSKGLVGPVLIAIAWIAMIAARFERERPRDAAGRRRLLACVAGLAAFLIPCAIWMVLFCLRADRALWYEWLWENHCGRLLGTAEHLGHIANNRPFFYARRLLLLILPWLALVVYWFAVVVVDLAKRAPVPPRRVFLLVWVIVTFVVLSVSATKRPVYLLPILPAFALMAADVFRERLPRWCRVCLAIWLGIAVAVLAGMAAFPLVVRALTSVAPDVRDFLAVRSFSVANGIAAAALAVSVCLLCRRRAVTYAARLVAVSALFYVGLFPVVNTSLDLDRGTAANVTALLAEIPPERRARVACWRFDENMVGYLYYYSDWTVASIDDPEQLRRIVRGEDGALDSVLTIESDGCSGAWHLGEVPYRILATTDLRYNGKNAGQMQWVQKWERPSPRRTDQARSSAASRLSLISGNQPAGECAGIPRP